MLPIINLTSNRGFKIRNFEEDKVATLKANSGLRYVGKIKDCYKFTGSFYLTNPEGKLIESFEIVILILKGYPNTFPLVFLVDDKIEKSDSYHIDSADGSICFEHTYVANAFARGELRLYDFINHYFPKYFSWVLVKKYGNADTLQEWAHRNDGTKQFYELLLDTVDKNTIHSFIKAYCEAKKINRNDKCYCGINKKLKCCHLEAALYLKATSKSVISKDLAIFDS